MGGVGALVVPPAPIGAVVPAGAVLAPAVGAVGAGAAVMPVAGAGPAAGAVLAPITGPVLLLSRALVCSSSVPVWRSPFCC